MKKFFTLFFLTFTIFVRADDTSNYTKIQDRCGLTIATPSLAQREMRKLRLENGLEILLISDPGTHESGAALAVGVGSWDDPEDRPGMAHFVEHLLFLGTKKYPEEEGYTRYLDEHGGTHNAFTMADRTVYMFSVNNAGFLEALDRFGQFFIEPLFTPSGVGRECKAIHQEYCKYQPLDTWRVHYVKKELANRKHPFHGFCIGNQDTLARISQDEVKTWYASHYSSNLMHLVVYSPLDLDQLEQEIVSIFSAVKNLEAKPHFCPEPLMNNQESTHLCFVAPLQQQQMLELSWEIPRFFGQDKQIHADKLLSYILGHEGSSSLLAQLKKENLACALSVGNFRAGNDQCLLSLYIELTANGVKEYEKVIERCFEAIASLQACGIPKYIFDEVCLIEELKYRFQSREEVFDLVCEYAMKLVDEPLETFPRLTLIPSVYDPDKVQELLTCMTAETCHYTLIAAPEITNIEPTVKEKWMGVEYALMPISSETLASWSNKEAHPNISIPRPNPFLPSTLTVSEKTTETPNALPPVSIIADEPCGKIYAAEDTKFFVPEICWIFSFKTPKISDSNPLSHVLADLYCHTVNETLKNTSYEALMGGLSFTLEPKHDAIELKIYGYSDKAYDLLGAIIATMKVACPTQEQFESFLEQFEREYANSLSVSPLKQAKETLLTILYKEYASLPQKSGVLKRASYERMRAFCKNVLKECYVEGMLYGNLADGLPNRAWVMIKHTLRFSPYAPHLHTKVELAYLPSQDSPAYLVSTSSGPANALILTIDCGQFSFKKRAAQEILTKGLEEPFFSELRTRQQTAYVVANWSQEIERHLYSFFAIQSSSHDTRDLLARFELFIETSLQHFSDQVIPKERFESIRTACIHQIEHQVENLCKTGTLLHKLAFDYDGEFDWLQKRIQAYQELTYEEFVAISQEFLGTENTRRLAVAIKGSLPKGHFTYRMLPHPERLRREISYEPRGKILN